MLDVQENPETELPLVEMPTKRELIVEEPLSADERRRAEALLKTSGKETA